GHRYVLRPIPLSSSAESALIVPGQTKISLEMAWGQWMLNPTGFANHRKHEVRVRLYRPGYQLVEIRPDHDSDTIQWKSAPSLADQEEAVDALLDMMNFGWWSPRSLFADWSSYLAPGSESPDHRSVVLFAASEYDRLAALSAMTGDYQDIRTRR